MKKNYVRENDAFKGLIDGNHYVVVRSTQGQSVDLQDQVHGDVITVPKTALEKAFVFEGNDTPFPDTKEGEYEIKDGHLFRDGQMIETGTLRPIEVIDYVNSGVYLTVEPKGADETGKELRFYDPEKDKFSVIARRADSYEVVYNDRMTIGVIARSTRDEKLQPEEEGKEPKTVHGVMERILFLIGTDILYHTVTVNRGYLFPNTGEAPEETAEYAVDSTCREEAFAKHLFFVLDRKVEAKTNMDGEVIYIEERPEEILDRKIDRSLVMKISVFYDGYRLAGPDTVFPETCSPRVEAQFFVVEGRVRKITPCFNTELDALVVTDQGITFSNFAFNSPRQAKGKEVLDLVEKYPHGIGLWVNKAGNQSVFTLCNDAYDMATIRVTKTRDRGYVNEIYHTAFGLGFGFEPAGDLE